MTPETATIVVSIIGGIVTLGCTLGGIYLTHALNKVQKAVAAHKEMNDWWHWKKNRKIFVFIIDDSPDDIELIERIVHETGNDCKSFDNEDEALTTIPEDPQVIILDYYLIKRTGLQMLREIKIKNPMHVAIVLSGATDPSLKMLFWEEGALIYIEKGEKNYEDKLKMAINRGMAMLQNL